MPRLDDSPKWLKPYLFHGVTGFDRGKYTDENVYGDCPFCRGEGKLAITTEDGRWRCFSCNQGNSNGKVDQGGNVYTFLRMLHEYSVSRTVSSDYEVLAEDRGLLDITTLEKWGVCKSLLTDEWLVPGYGLDGKEVNQLYRYTLMRKKLKNGSFKESYRLLATPEIGHTIFGTQLIDERKEGYYVCEGPWDAMVLWETLTKTLKDKTLRVSYAELLPYNVLAVPGCSTFNEKWGDTLFTDKKVVLLYDNDYPRKDPVSSKRIDPVGYSSMKRVSGLLLGSHRPPKEVKYLQWSSSGEDHDTGLKDGFDIRDALTLGSGVTPSSFPVPSSSVPSLVENRIGVFDTLAVNFILAPTIWRVEREKIKKELEPIPCKDWKTLVSAWRKAMKWTEGHDRALSVMLSAVASTMVKGDQLWIKLISPASTGKTELCEALSTARRFVKPVSSIRGFHSGAKAVGGGDEDLSLLATLDGKTMVTKDGDTLLQSPGLRQILSEARDIYDRTSRTHYRHGVSRDYNNVSMTWLLCGTSSLRSIDSSELGERFLDCVIMEDIDDDLEDEILVRIVHRVERNLGSGEATGKASDRYDLDMANAHQLTGGYVIYLRENIHKILPKISVTDYSRRKCAILAKYVAYMRARPSSTQDETAEREFAGRLVSQLFKLTACLAAVLNRDSTDNEVMRRTTQVAMDTARGRTAEIAKYLFDLGEEGSEIRGIWLTIGETEIKTRTLLRFLLRIGVVERFTPTSKHKGISFKNHWRLTPRMTRIFSEVTEQEPGQKKGGIRNSSGRIGGKGISSTNTSNGKGKYKLNGFSNGYNGKVSHRGENDRIVHDGDRIEEESE
jgi:hypothetical protein